MKEVVYIVDDDASVREGLGDLLRSVGLGVQTFASSQEFLDSKRADAPGCIILDVRLPGRSGLEFQNSAAESEHSASRHFHQRPRRRSDLGARNEIRRHRVPDEAAA